MARTAIACFAALAYRVYHPGDKRKGPVNVCGVTSGGVLSYVTRVIFASSFEMPKVITGVWFSVGVVSYVVCGRYHHKSKLERGSGWNI